MKSESFGSCPREASLPARKGIGVVRYMTSPWKEAIIMWPMEKNIAEKFFLPAVFPCCKACTVAAWIFLGSLKLFSSRINKSPLYLNVSLNAGHVLGRWVCCGSNLVSKQ